MGSRNQAKIFSMGAAILLMFATEIIVGYHYWRMLTGISLVAIVGLGVVAYVLFWSSWWASSEQEDKPVKFTAYAVAAAVSITMIFNAAAVIVILRKDFKSEVQQTQDLTRMRARAEENRKLIKDSGADWRQLREFNRAEAEREAVTKNVTSVNSDESTATWLARVEEYGQFWIFLIPLMVAIIGKFVLLAAIALPGGAEGYAPNKSIGFTGNTSYNFAPQTAKSDPKDQPR